VVYFSGHGDYDEDIDLGYWIPVDEQNRKQGLNNDYITRFLNRIESHHTLLLCDSCFSGSLLLDSPTKNISNRYYQHPSRWAITSGSKELVSDGKEHSPFAEALLKKLRQHQGDLNVLELGQAILENVAVRELQKPLFAPLRLPAHQGGMFVFLQRKNEEADWKVAEAENTILAYSRFRRKYRNSTHYEEAKHRIKALEEEAAWQKALRRNRVSDYEDYLDDYPGGVHAEEAHQRMEDILAGIVIKPTVDKKVNTKKESEIEFGTFSDSRDGQTYRTVQLNGLEWMADNFKYDIGYGCWSYHNDDRNSDIYGRLYTLEGAKKACPEGWRLPSDEEWQFTIWEFGGLYDETLDEYIFSKDSQRAYPFIMKELNISKLGGYFDQHENYFGNINRVGSYWSSDKIFNGNYIYFDFVKEKKEIFRKQHPGNIGLSVRYVRSIENESEIETPSAKLIFPKEEPRIEIPRLDFEPEMIFVEGGTFMMGKKGIAEPVHEVTLSDFYIGKYPVTQAQWQAVMGANPSYFKGCDDCPVEKVSWEDVQEFIKKLNAKTGKNYRLPTEAEWEYVARGGKQSKGFTYAGSNKLDEVGWYDGNSSSKTHPVGQKKPNELGIHDMSGNVWEWVEDCWNDSYKGAPTDGSAWRSGDSSRRVVRGGAWYNDGDLCRASVRLRYNSGYRNDDVGFRVLRD